MHVVATAGHVDHGKSALVTALTGTDPDRFPEEKARGLTIDLGFAFAELASGEVVGFVDVPGHVRFVKNMLAGAGAVEVALLVVAANEGWMPQSQEHSQILDLLGVRHGLVALTKADLVDTETLELAQVELTEQLEGTTLEPWPVVAVDSISGRGLDRLTATLQGVLESAPLPADRGRPRLWIDRVFSPRGAGTVVTGTMAGGTLAVDDRVLLVPGDLAARVRGIESRGQKVDAARPGSRVALNLAGVDHTDLRRGMAVVRADQWAHVATVDVSTTLLAGERLATRGRLHAHVGSGEHEVRYRLLDEAKLARLTYARPLPLAPGDRLVLRSSARRRTVGGAEILDVAPARRIADAKRRLALPLPARLLDTRPIATTAELMTLGGLDDKGAAELGESMVTEGLAVALGRWTVAAETCHALVAEIETRVAAHHLAHPLDAGVDLARLATELQVDPALLRALVETTGDLEVDREVVRDKNHRGRPTDDPEAAAWLSSMADSPFSPPQPRDADVVPATVSALSRSGFVQEVDGVWFTTDALAQARQIAGREVLERGSLTISELRDIFGSTRKFVVPLAGHLDATGVTRRRGDTRVPGPRAERAP